MMAPLPTAALQAAVVKALNAKFDGRAKVYDRVPTKLALPYITIGTIETNDDSHCDAAWECFVTCHSWSDKVGKPEINQLNSDIAEALGLEIDVAGFVCVLGEFQTADSFVEGDGLTMHGVVRCRYLIDQYV